MNKNTVRVALLLFGSGLCALVYQTVWLREFRLIFGASTAASAAVLAIFMGGLGLGSLLLGPRADRHPKPLAFYAVLEFGIAASAAATPFLVWVIRELYVALGGTPTLGLTAGTAIRIVLSVLVLGVPTVLMGGTLPAASRSVEEEGDRSRRRLALLYGLNTIGAVGGVALATFAMLEIYGNRLTLWLACLVNVLIAVVARSFAREMPTLEPESAPEADAEGETGQMQAPAAPFGFVLAAAALVGFAFLLMELVWYRMLSPLLGGSTFTFGLILAVALAGVGLGGALYSILMGNERATLRGFAVTCAVEALCVVLPFALGDRIALLALLLRPLGSLGFVGFSLGWTVVAGLVVLPAALVAGFQFPMLIALLGQGRRDVGRHVGLAYTWNTAGAIAGSLAGGFGILPLLTGPGTWRLVVAILSALSFAAVAVSVRGASLRGVVRRASVPALATAVAVLLLSTQGPTAAWRHSGIGAGRAGDPGATRNAVRAWISHQKRALHWEAEGVESSVALLSTDALAFTVNGKVDGNAHGDAGTQVMSGLVGAMIHPNPQRSLVVGLGTGSTAGWLGKVPSMVEVDVVELEPAILHVARECAPVNKSVLDNPKVDVFIGDAREVLLTTPERYDLIFSEPSNPYRAGIASLFTKDFYVAARQRLAPGGIFLQWLQAYEVDSRTIRTVYATLGDVFPSVETWRTLGGDFLLVGSVEPITYDVARMRERVAQEPFREALYGAWRTESVEGVFAHYVANDGLARLLASHSNITRNTDDRNVVEFAFARSVGRSAGFDRLEFFRFIRERGFHLPLSTTEPIDWRTVHERRSTMAAYEDVDRKISPEGDLDFQSRHRALMKYADGDLRAALTAFRTQGGQPSDSMQLLMLAESLADEGNADAEALAERLHAVSAIEADAVLARLRFRQQRHAEAAALLESAFIGYRADPWPYKPLMQRLLTLAEGIVNADATQGERLYDALIQPFSVFNLEAKRLISCMHIGLTIDPPFPKSRVINAIAPFEGAPFWDQPFLTIRRDAYVSAGHPLADRAQRDLWEYLDAEPERFAAGLEPLPDAVR